MFTGLIERLGRVRALTRESGKVRLTVDSDMPQGEVALGDSIAIDGCCLTVVAKATGSLSFDAAPETLRRTTLGERQPGDPVHLERAMQLGDRLDGHLVQGHVDGVGRLRTRRREGDALVLEIDVPPPLLRYAVEKGGISLDGCSLTLTAVGVDHCSVMLVPFTQQKTHFADKALGAGINVEVDLIAKYVEKLCGRAPGVDVQTLKENGFS